MGLVISFAGPCQAPEGCSSTKAFLLFFLGRPERRRKEEGQERGDEKKGDEEELNRACI